MLKVYLASPFFNPSQVAVVERLERLISPMKDFVLYSPRSEGVLIEMTPAEKKAAARKIFETNIWRLRWADLLVAVVDGRDTGTTWEMGYACGIGKPVFTYTDQDYGLNVMIQESVRAHARGIEEMRLVLEAVAVGDQAEIDRHRNFDPGLT